MAQFTSLVIAYVVGGLTFVPLIVVVILCHAYLTLPQPNGATPPVDTATGIDDDEDETLKAKLRRRSHEPNVAAGYFAVCREYVPGGVNGKPPERTTPAGEIIAAESPSVYQSMYRSIFDRGKTQAPSIEGNKVVKKARNVFYVVLRHGHILLFDNADQLEVRHVIALTHYHVDIYAGGEAIPEGELWVKRNCIRLTKKTTGSVAVTSMPFYLFSENCSEKEDFYHTLLCNQERDSNGIENPPTTQPFESEDMIRLIRQLHVTDPNSPTRWLNALLGRVFLAIYKTNVVEDHIRTKFTKKMARVSKPNFITSLKMEEVDMGHSAPLFSNPKLKEMTVDGALTIEMDVKYNGDFRVVIAAVARIDLGTRFKAREVDLVLAGILRKVEGHILIKVKPPPSNRVWLSFETMPKLEMSLEPIVSSRQITYGIILRAIESKVREVFSETLVSPNWDDFSFMDTSSQKYRGGIWIDEDKTKPLLETADVQTQQNSLEGKSLISPSKEPSPAASIAASVSSTPDVKSTAPPSLWQNSKAPTKRAPARQSESRSTAVDATASSQASESTQQNSSPDRPRAMRTNSFASAAVPVVSKGPTVVDNPSRPASKNGPQDATSAMRILSSRSRDNSPLNSPVGSPSSGPNYLNRRNSSSKSNSETPDIPERDTKDSFITTSDGDIVSAVITSYEKKPRKSLSEPAPAETTPIPIPSGTPTRSATLRSLAAFPPEKRVAINQSITSATAAAKNWGWNVLNRQNEKKTSSIPTQPIGRGQPLPPPGTPLPKPATNWSATANALGSLRRKPVGIAVSDKAGAVSLEPSPPSPAISSMTASSREESDTGTEVTTEQTSSQEALPQDLLSEDRLSSDLPHSDPEAKDDDNPTPTSVAQPEANYDDNPTRTSVVQPKAKYDNNPTPKSMVQPEEDSENLAINPAALAAITATKTTAAAAAADAAAAAEAAAQEQDDIAEALAWEEAENRWNPVHVEHS